MADANDIDKWSEQHVGSLALTRTVLGFLNVGIGLLLLIKVFGVV